MMSVSKDDFDAWVKKAECISLFYNCIEHPLRPGLDELARADRTAKMLRDKMIARLTGTTSEEDFILECWFEAVSKEFCNLDRQLEDYTLNVGIAKNWDLDKAIEEVRKKVLEKNVNKRFANRILSFSNFFWKENKEYYQKKRECVHGKAKANTEKIKIAKNFLKMGLSVEQVAQGTGLSVEDIQKL
ncbi:MAG: hypothetical protein IJ730_04720 [Alphaproteobacteria bacterium]|nr:hypothetical protein [Alphaproteobacteria bacterium]MBR2137527.1 hypothetical protein [Alphaproteobacteria bacterium]